MSDQPATPPKPKVGSLRDRIAAFEKSASSAPAPAPAPAPRPKPAGFATWKPKVPSPPSSPSAAATATPSTEHAASSPPAKLGGMSASDAKESITKAGSLKDRMAALQGKGGFGAPTPLAPKPASEKPKWKPPPVVQAPVDDDDHTAEGSAPAGIAAAVERTLSPPASVKSQEGVEPPKIGESGEESASSDAQAVAEDDNAGEAAALDPEEEERQRRAAIAARMARLGGARVGMAPPVFGKKPPVRRPTQEEAPVTVEDVPRSEPVSSPEPSKPVEIVASPPLPEDATPVTSPPNESQPAEHFSKSPESLLSRKTSDGASILSAESAEAQSVKSPSSMPVPAVPRRAGPPRRKPAKPAAPPPEVPEEHTPVANEIEEPTEQPVVKSESPPLPLSEEAVKSLESEESKEAFGGDVNSPPIQSIPSSPNREKSTSHHESGAEIVSEREGQEIPSTSPQDVFTDTSTSIPEDTSGFLSPPPTSVTDASENLAEVDEDELAHGRHLAMSLADPAAINAVDERLLAEAQPTPLSGEEHEELVEEDELAEDEARKKRVAERIAKMGGVNPFAPPPPPQRTASSETAHSPAAVASAPIATSHSPLESSPHDEGQEQNSHLVTSNPAHGGQTEPASESKPDEEFSDEVEDMDDEDNASEYDSSVPQDSIEHTQGSAKEPIPHFNEPVPVQVSHASRAPPVPLSTRPAVQVQQFNEANNDGENQEASDEEMLPASSDVAITKQPSPPQQGRPAQPPRRVIPQAPEEDEGGEEEDEETDEEIDERLAQSQLFVPPPSGQRAPATIPPRRQFSRDEEDGDGSENDAPALPHLQRRSAEGPPARSLSPPSDYASEPDSDHDGRALPIPPRNAGGHPPPARNAPPPPPPHQESQDDDSEPEDARPVRRSLSERQRTDDNAGPISPSLLTPAFSLSGSEEVLDEEEGDPIDPSFHSPDRSSSSVNLHAAAQYLAMPAGVRTSLPVQLPTSTSPPPPPAPPVAASSSGVEAREETEQDSEQLRRRTIAERMAKLGGIKFGAAPPVPASRPPPPPAPPRDENEESAGDFEEGEKPEVLSEEEEERARKERISAKMAQMGGMRIGMMPMGMGSLPPQPSHALRRDSAPKSPPLPPSGPPTRAVPPSRPPPPPTQLPPQPQAGDSESEYGSAAASEDGVKVEAEESELEEVAYEDAQEPEEEAPPPPVPSRATRRVSQRQDSHEQATSSHVPSSRPPVPTSIPTRRSSVQTTRSTTGSSAGDTAYNIPPRKSSGLMPASQSDYVMVEEPETPPIPPVRPTSRAFPSRRASQMPTTSTAAKQSTDPSDSMSQWELPSIPMSALDFGAGADLSLSWTDAGNEPMPTSPPPPPPPAKKASTSSELNLSADDLMALWGRVGVQVCEVATSMFEKSRKTLVGDGSYAGFLQAVFAAVPNAAPVPTPAGEWGYLMYVQNGPSVQKRASEIMPGDIVEIQDAKLKGHKGLQTYHQNVGGAGEVLLGVVGEFEAKKAKIRVFHANQHVGQQTVESVSYRLEDLKSGIVKVYRVLEA